ncbi:hypothetical protein L5M16_07465 [Shewanella sp. SM103]|uniref:hypothetical protein n=1 Tax=unclassified Shewanella TaxID=196818 RepID=UPI0021DA1DC6|nr:MULTISPECIES: hypothetical protein [unclassified Shewanella]MCU8007170.1 hypothetical protein [Shewanella sp. SM87]MCU8078410.1 hypothetical protein [Shewanella sp. SM103]
MSKINNAVFARGIHYVGLLVVDLDADAELMFVTDRTNCESLLVCQRSPTGIVKKILPIGFTLVNRLIVTIVDKDMVYGAKCVDGVMLEQADANTVDMSQ